MIKNLLIISYEEFPSFIGLTTRIKGIAQAIIGYGFGVEIVAPFYANKIRIPQKYFKNVKIHNIRMPNLFGKFKLPIVSRLLFVLLYTIRVSLNLGKSRANYAFVQSEHIYPFWSSYILGKKFKAEIILDEPTMFEKMIDHKVKRIKPLGYILKKIVNSYELIVYKKSKYIICSSDKTLAYVKERLKDDRNKLYYLPNGVDLNEYKQQKKAIFSNKIFFNCSLPYYQNLSAFNNLIKIIECFDDHNFINYFVQIVVNNKKYIPKKQNNIIKLNDRVSILSGVENLVSLIQEADMVVLPYEKGHFSNAGSRLKALEAFSCGKVVLATIEGIDGLHGCINGENIIICKDWIDMANKIMDLISRNNKSYQIDKIKDNARSLVEKRYSWEKLADFYVNFLI